MIHLFIFDLLIILLNFVSIFKYIIFLNLNHLLSMMSDYCYYCLNYYYGSSSLVFFIYFIVFLFFVIYQIINFIFFSLIIILYVYISLFCHYNIPCHFIFDVILYDFVILIIDIEFIYCIINRVIIYISISIVFSIIYSILLKHSSNLLIFIYLPHLIILIDLFILNIGLFIHLKFHISYLSYNSILHNILISHNIIQSVSVIIIFFKHNFFI